uniref:Putative ovule protein n=1 Tax=Solanum chacoense TaxID=4108 RepID=A0A0V0H4Q5_SOLCH
MCSRLKITYLSFADGLLMFARGDQISVQLLHDKFTVFTAASGLKADLSKSAIYFGGVFGTVMSHIQQTLGYSHGALPFRYLGIPLFTKKLNLIQWKPLLIK